MLERPAPAILEKCEVKQLATEHRFAQHIERSRGLRVCICTKSTHAFRVRHNRLLIEARHVLDDLLGLAATARILALPLLLGKVLTECVEPLIHPSPLALVTVNNHGKPVVTNFMNHNTNETPLRSCGVCAILFRARSVE